MKTPLAVAAVVAGLLLAPAAALAARPTTPAPAATATVDWQIPLKAQAGFTHALGSAQYQAQPGQRELQVEVTRLGSLAGRSVLVRVGGATVSSVKVSSRGIADLTRNTELGQTVPSIAHGSRVSVQTQAGAVIASGTF